MNIVLARALLAGCAFLSTAATAATVTPTNSQGWAPANVRGAGTVAIDTAYPDNGQGSLHFTSSGSGDKADYVNNWGVVAGRTLGSISSISYSYLRSSASSTTSFLAPAFRLSFYDQPTNKLGYLIFEPVYQPPGNAAVPTNTWVDADITNANFWMRTFSPGSTVEAYDITLKEWAAGVRPAPNAYVLSASTYIYGIEVGVGSGWSGTFDGAVDNVAIAFGRDAITADFEPDATAAVPEPATWAMVVLGFGAVGFGLRRRKPSVRFA